VCKSVGLPLFDHWKNLHARYSLQDFKINVFITNIATSFIIFLEPTGYLNHFTNPNNLSTVNLLNEHWTILYLVSFLVKGNKPWIQSKAREERKLSFKTHSYLGPIWQFSITNTSTTIPKASRKTRERVWFSCYNQFFKTWHCWSHDILRDRNYCTSSEHRDGHKARFWCILLVAVKRVSTVFLWDRYGLSTHLNNTRYNNAADNEIRMKRLL